MDEAIRNFAQQFSFDPLMQNEAHYARTEKYIIAGMGGSSLAGGILKRLDASKNIIIHRDYGLPKMSDGEIKNYTLIAISYSGNTEETIDALNKALEKKLNVLIIATGGHLVKIAEEHSLPYIKLPDTGIQPRSALGFSLLALLKAVGDEENTRNTHGLSGVLNPSDAEKSGKDIAEWLHGHIPIIYSGTENSIVSYNWKIKFNETGKIPAFFNVFPELTHNEMTGFDSTKELVGPFAFILLPDETDHLRVQKQMDVFAHMLIERNMKLKIIPLQGGTLLYRIFSSLLIADWAAYFTALAYGLEPEHVPMVESFKKKIA